MEKVRRLYWIPWKQQYPLTQPYPHADSEVRLVFSFIPKDDWIVSAFTLLPIFCHYWIHIPLYVRPHSTLHFLDCSQKQSLPPWKLHLRLKYTPHNSKKKKLKQKERQLLHRKIMVKSMKELKFITTETLVLSEFVRNVLQSKKFQKDRFHHRFWACKNCSFLSFLLK